MTFHDNKPLQPLVNERWEDFNIKPTLSIPDILGWVSFRALNILYIYIYYEIIFVRWDMIFKYLSNFGDFNAYCLRLSAENITLK